MQVHLLTPHLCCSSTRVLMAVYIPEAIAVSVCKATFQISEEVIGHWLIKLYVLFWWWARDGFVGVFNTQAQPWEDQWQLCWPQVRRFSVHRSFPEPFFLHLEILQTCTFKKKKKTHTHKDTMHSSPVLLAYLSQWWSIQYICRLPSRACCIWFVSEWHQKMPGWVQRMLWLQWSAASPAFPCCSHLYQQHSRRTDEDSGIVIAWRPPPLWLLCGHSDFKINNTSYPQLSDRPGALMLQGCLWRPWILSVSQGS